MTLWSVEVSHLSIPVGPWSSCPWAWASSGRCPPAPGGTCTCGRASSRPGMGGAMTSVTSVTSVTVQVTSLVVVGRVRAGAAVHPAGQLRCAARVGLDLGLLGVEPAGELGLRHHPDVEEHEGVVEPTELRALAPEVPRVQGIEVEAGRVAGAGVAAEVELGHVEAGQHVE